MLFNSYIFIFAFLPLTLAGFFLIGARGHHRIAISWLVACSLFFYGWWNPAYLGLILASILFNYAMGVVLSGGAGRGLLALGVAANLGLLGYFKYANFFVDSLNFVIGTGFHLETILLPLAISFFTFQQIAYLVDAHRGETREYNFLHYCLFVTFFPQLIAGPIVHHREMLPQFARDAIYRFRHRDFAIGCAIFAIGLFKKVVLADGVAVYAIPVFGAAEAGIPLSFVEAWGGALAYTLQIYFDFSGYSDMAIGLGRMFGIRLPLNFHSPLKALNLIEFWHRWHMTLSRFLRDYLYIPLGGNRKGPARRYVNLFVTMLLGGVWHGAGWTFVVWGAAHGAVLAANHGWHAARRTLGLDSRQSTRASRMAAGTLTFLFIVCSFVLFRAESFEGAWRMLGAMTGSNGVVLPDGLGELASAWQHGLASLGVRFGEHVPNELASWGDGFPMIVALWLLVWLAPNTQQILRDFEPAFDTYRGGQLGRSPGRPRFALTPAWAVVVAMLLVYAVGSLTRATEFLYFQF
ncbi:MAG: MBOAT family protein [Xanthomonadales bacterium]|nr:MBOAT family protein [Xanthomonadales bacterium]